MRVVVDGFMVNLSLCGLHSCRVDVM